MRAQLRIGERVEEVEASWLIGCDGLHSTVRETLGIRFAGSTYPELFVLADIKLHADFADAAARVFLGEKGALAFFPMAEGRWRLIVTNSPADWRQEPSLAQCQALVDERGPGGIGLADPRWISVFRIHRREAGRQLDFHDCILCDRDRRQGRRRERAILSPHRLYAAAAGSDAG